MVYSKGMMAPEHIQDVYRELMALSKLVPMKKNNIGSK